MQRYWRRLSFIPLLLCCASCALFAPKEDRFGARPISFADFDGWQEDDHAAGLEAFLKSCPILAQKPRDRSSGSGLVIDASLWQSLCDEAAFARGNPAQARFFFEQRFQPFRINNNGREQGLFTGYYEPVLYGQNHKGGDFMYPLYMAPKNLKDLKPYFTRQEIDDGALAKKKLEIVWVDDPVMLFFLHIQGSGRIKFYNKEMRVGYADQNGHSYVSLGKVMIDEGLMKKEDVNFFTLRQWLYTHQSQAFEMMQRNPSYVFFREIKGEEGPLGAIGAPVTPQRSLAVDSRYIPYGLPLYLNTELPAEPGLKPVAFRRLVIAQDTGGAIKGPVRGDIFFGVGDQAEYFAGYMKGKGTYDLLVPKEIVSQLQTP